MYCCCTGHAHIKLEFWTNFRVCEYLAYIMFSEYVYKIVLANYLVNSEHYFQDILHFSL